MHAFAESIIETTFDIEDVMCRLAAHDQSALSELYDQFGRLVFSIALRVVQNPMLAEEITQDTFLKLWHQPASWDSQRGKFVSWLLTITRYTAIDRLRKEQRRPLSHAVELDEVRLGRRGWIDDETWLDARLLRAHMRRLPPEQLEVIELAFFEGMTHSELAEHLGLPLGTVKTRIRLGLQKLKAYS